MLPDTPPRLQWSVPQRMGDERGLIWFPQNGPHRHYKQKEPHRFGTMTFDLQDRRQRVGLDTATPAFPPVLVIIYQATVRRRFLVRRRRRAWEIALQGLRADTDVNEAVPALHSLIVVEVAFSTGRWYGPASAIRTGVFRSAEGL